MSIEIADNEVTNEKQEVKEQLPGNREYFNGESGWYAEGAVDPRVLERELNVDEEKRGLSSSQFFALLERLTEATGGMMLPQGQPSEEVRVCEDA